MDTDDEQKKNEWRPELDPPGRRVIEDDNFRAEIDAKGHVALYNKQIAEDGDEHRGYLGTVGMDFLARVVCEPGLNTVPPRWADRMLWFARAYLLDAREVAAKWMERARDVDPDAVPTDGSVVETMGAADLVGFAKSMRDIVIRARG